MKILLTGSSGYVGSALAPKLRAHGHEVYGCDVEWFNTVPTYPAFRDVRKIEDITGIDAIIHLAAISNDPSVSHYPRLSWETSCLALQQLCQLSIGNLINTGKTARFIYASSVSVYGADRGMVTEDMDLRPLSDYNKTKMCAERILLSYPELKPQIIRPATICGLSPRMRLDLTVNMFTVQALKDRRMTVHGGQQYRPSIHIDDMCDVYLWMLDHPELTGIFNAGFENNTLLEIARMVRQCTDADVDITDQRDTRSYQVNSDKLLATGFKPTKTIFDAIMEIMQAWHGGWRDRPEMVNLSWMQERGIRDE